LKKVAYKPQPKFIVKEFGMPKNTTGKQAALSEARSKRSFEKPKLTYVKPKLSKQGKVAQVTQSFFGSFSP